MYANGKKCYYESLLNFESAWENRGFPNLNWRERPVILVDNRIIDDAFENVKARKAASQSWIIAGIPNRTGYDLVTHIVHHFLEEGVISNDWHSSAIVNCYKSKEDALDRSNYRGNKLLD